MTTYIAYEIDVTWHETAGAYKRQIDGRVDGVRAAKALKSAVAEHDRMGRMFNVYAFTAAGERVELDSAAIGRLG